MPAQKRYLSNYQDDNNNNEDDDENSPQHQHRRRKHSRRVAGEQTRANMEEQQVDEQEEEEDEQTQAQDNDDEDEDDQEEINQSSEDDSEGSGTDPEAFDELIAVSRSEIRTNVQCPICLGIIKRTRVVMGCQHRFCRECIDKSMRLGNNECPACRIHCASRRSLRDDPGFDTLIEAIYPDVEKYEEEELVFLEEERALNEQIQASIAQISQRQSEALIKRRKVGKDIAASSAQRTPRNYHNAYSRRRRNSQGAEPERSDPNESENDDHDRNKDSPPKDERGTQTKFRKRRRRKGALATPTSPSAASPDGGHIETAAELPRETVGNSTGPALKPETLTWGRGGVRSHSRHGSASGSRNARNTRISKLVDYLESVRTNDGELNIHLELIPLDKQTTPSLKKPHLCCRPSTSVEHLYEFVAQDIKSQVKDVELLAVKDNTTVNHSTLMDASNMLARVVSGSNVTLQSLERQETLEGINSSCPLNKNLILAYVQNNSEV
ncbi:putative E3 ubiquitin-protein ligase RING1a isoform X2 [Nicotiana tabacum]|uniref:E3 ubiquitin-protein ligase RING1a isoform X2 n=2 Tax=Nicotiana TaxID=4085 RepID=A0A1S4AIW1_TOBAC|nr:PREDICTED: putative E3 ubiquitin-protein ligase RING1a isoform X2 [Nicotiana sylvestris]XP_016476549.1 PREDICTED: putative E3 ubiquitin-protein ligase RING1a isoform X2 [Nicotiana tabacum]